MFSFFSNFGFGSSGPIIPPPQTVTSNIPVENKVYPVLTTPPTMFIPVGCVGMTRFDYDSYRLDKAPFLSYSFSSQNVQHTMDIIKYLFEKLPIYQKQDLSIPPRDPAPYPTRMNPDKPHVFEINGINDPSKRIYGPVYLYIAKDFSKTPASIKNYLFFPSMTPDGLPWTSYYYLGMCHRWMHRILLGPSYFIRRPRSNCMHRWADAPSLPLGCRTDSGWTCLQSKRNHKKMRLYKRGKKRDLYPAVYFRTYMINLADPALSPYVNPNTFTDLQRNVLPSEMDMYVGCRYMLVSPNKQFMYVLGNTKVGLLLNLNPSVSFEWYCGINVIPSTYVPIDIKEFTGGYSTRLVLEEGYVRIYSKTSFLSGEEDVVAMFPASVSDATFPLALVLTNDGKLVVYDVNNRIVSTGEFSTTGYDSGVYGGYDPDEDFRQRIINLIAYLKSINRYQDVLGPDGSDAKPTIAPEIVMENVEPYDSTQDYVDRMRRMIDKLRMEGRLKSNDPYADELYNSTQNIIRESQIQGGYGGVTQTQIQSYQPATPKPPFPGVSIIAPTLSTSGTALDISKYGSGSETVEAKSSLIMDTGNSTNPLENIENDDTAVAFIDKNEADQAAAEQSTQEKIEASEASIEQAGANNTVSEISPYSLDPNSPFGGSNEYSALYNPSGSPSGSAVTGSSPFASQYSTWVPPSCPLDPSIPNPNPKDDFYCRLIGLREYLRGMNRRIEDPLEKNEVWQPPTSETLDWFDYEGDRKKRIDIYSSKYAPLSS